MIEFFLINQIFVVLITIFGLWLGFWVLFPDKKAKVNQLFFLMTILIILWNIFAYLGFSATEVEKSIFWYRLNWGAVTLFFVFAYFFSLYFPKKVKKYPILDSVIVFWGIFFVYFSVFTDLLIKSAILTEWGMEIIFGEGKFFFYSTTTLITFLIFYLFFKKKYFILSKEERTRVQYFLVGISIFALMNIIFNVIVPFITGTIKFWQFGTYSAIFFLGFTAYAIVKQQLFGIKVVLTALLVALIAILLLLDAVLLTEGVAFQVFKGVILIVFLYFGYLLIRSVQMEIRRREEIERIDRAKSEFISIASHQLRTPLTAVKGYISMILEGTYGQLSEKQSKPLGNVYQSNERLIKLVNDLLNLSRLDAGKIEFSPEPTSLEEMVSGIVEELKINAENKDLYMKMIKPSTPLPKIMVDQDKLRQVILNILDNAIKYTKEGGITFELKKLDGKEEVRVSDTGEGMDERELNSLFQMFSRATAGAQLHTEGAGIGLYVARQFVEMHGGKIWAESPGKGKGSAFIIQLPIKLDPKLLKEKTKTITKAADDIF